MAEKKLSERDKSRGRRAVARASGTKSRGAVPMARLYPEIERLKDQGMTIPQIAAALGRSDRYIRRVRSWGRMHSSSMYVELPDPRSPEDLEGWVQEFLPYTAEAFEKFFVYFSGYDYLPEHLKEAVSLAISEPRLLINMPPRHAKSEIFSVWFPLWRICRDRNVQILLLSQTEALAKKFTNEITYNLMYNEKMISAFGRFKPETIDWPWRPLSGEIMVEGRTRESKPGDMTLQVRGGKQQILGMEADLVVIDDPTTPEVSESETQRRTMEDRVKGQALTRLNPDGQAICIGQRVHLQDIFGHLEALRIARGPRAGEPVWKTVKMRAIQDWGDETEEPKVLWPEVWDYDALMGRYADLGESLFETMFQQNPMPLGELIVRPEWIWGGDGYAGCVDRQRSPYLGIERDVYLPVSRVVSIDPSPQRYAGVVVADVAFLEKEFVASILETKSEKMTMRDTVEEIDRLLRQYGPVDYLIFEASVFARWLFEDPYFQKIRYLTRVIPHQTTGSNKKDPYLGVNSLAIEFEKGQIRFPYGDPEARKMTDSFLNEELFTYPQGDKDDRLMALWFIKSRWQTLRPTRNLPTRVGIKPRGTAWMRNNPKRGR